MKLKQKATLGLCLLSSWFVCNGTLVTAQTEGGRLEGRVFYRCNGQPAEGYFVYIFPGSDGYAVSYTRAKVDNSGKYVQGVHGNDYRLIASANPNARGFSYFQKRVTVAEGETTTVEDIHVDFCPDLKLLAPPDEAVVEAARPRFAWEPFPGEVEYRVVIYLEDGKTLRVPKYYEPGTQETELSAPEDLPPGNHQWRVVLHKKGDFDRFGESGMWRLTVK